jgi:hypothetical protein
MKKCVRCNNEHDGSFGSGKYCNRSCANARTHSKETKDKIAKASLGKEPSNKGKLLKWETTKCLYCKTDIKHRSSTPKKYHSECWKNVAGGLRIGAGRGKSGWYKGIWCDSSYELVWVIYQLEHNIPFERNKVKYSYEWKGKILQYTPDFIQSNSVIEIKGFMTEQTKAKIQSVNNLIVLFKNDLENEFNYVLTKYGNNFIELYEGNPHKVKQNKCKVCGKPAKHLYCSRLCGGKGTKK